MRLVYFGTPDFAVPTLERLIAAPEHEVVGVVSQPDRPRGRGRAVHPSSVSALATAHGIPLLRPEKVGDAETVGALRALAPELGVVAAFGQFLPRAVRELPSRGHLNHAHASVLPRHRGAAPIARANLAGDTETGVSVMRVAKEMDAGPVALVRTTPIGPDENAGALTERLAAIAADAIALGLAAIAEDRVSWSPQDDSLATLAPKLGPADQPLRWSEPARILALRVRALAPTPGARTLHEGEALRVLAARAEPGPTDRAPGVVRVGADRVLRIATGDGWLVPERLQRAGGKPLAVDAYLRGRPISDGARLGDA
jgi:methionyl-tRNA formyltransferase